MSGAVYPRMFMHINVLFAYPPGNGQGVPEKVVTLLNHSKLPAPFCC